MKFNLPFSPSIASFRHKLPGAVQRAVVYTLLFVGLILLSVPATDSANAQQESSSYIRQKRAMEAADLGIEHPAALAFSPSANAFHVIEARPQAPSSFTDIVTLTPTADRGATARIAAAVRDPINTAFDAHSNRLLTYQAEPRQLIEVLADADGNLDPRTLVRHNVRHFGLESPQGMTVDRATGDLFILDGAAPRIVRVEREADGTFSNASVSEIDLRSTGLVDPRGLALDPTTGHFHIVHPAEQKLVELTKSGQVVTSRDLSEFELADPGAIVFAPSGDLTDDPAQMSLYLAERGASGMQQGNLSTNETEIAAVESAAGDSSAAPDTGDILELTFVEAPAVSAATFTSSLVQTIDASAWNPPSPDSSGVVYLPASDRLMVVDGEVNEMTIYDGANAFEADLSGNLLGTWNTLSFSSEPTGVSINPENEHLFISQDSGGRRVHEIDAGPDGAYGTADDSVNSLINTADFGSSDPEGVTYATGLGAIFIADGVNNEVYRVDPGANGVFDGVAPDGDDQVTSFDTFDLGLEDPEGIAYNSDSGNLYVSGKPSTTVFEVTTDGSLVQLLDVSAANARKLSGIGYGPSSVDPSARVVYVADRGVDNNSDPNENDGRIYELTVSLGPNVPPVASDDNASTVENTAATIDVAANDSDANGNLVPASATTTCSTCDEPSSGTLNNNGDGTFTYTPDMGFTGSDSFIYEICDSDNLCDTATVSVTVTVNDPPIANDDSVSTSVHIAVIIDVAANDSDANGNLDPASTNTNCDGCTLPTSGTLDNNGDGTFNYLPHPGFSGADGFVYQICDTAGECDAGTVTISVENIVEVRVSASEDDAEEQESLSVGLTSSDLELVLEDSNQTVGMRFNELAIPQGATITHAYVQFQADETNSEATSLTIQGEATDDALNFVDADGNISNRPRTAAAVLWAPTAWTARGEAGPDQRTPDLASIVQEVVNRSGWASGNALVLIITGSGKRVAESYDGVSAAAPLLRVEYTTGGEANLTPIANDDVYTTYEDTSLTVVAPGVLDNDSDEDGDELTAVLDTSPGNGNLTFNADGSFDYTPNANFDGTDSFTYHVNDGTADSQVATVTITVNAINDAPVASDDAYATEGETTLTVTAPGVLGNDSDLENDPLAAVLDAGPTNGSLTLNADGSFNYTPNAGFTGTDSFTYQANDGTSDSNVATVTVTVSAVNNAPVAGDDAYTSDEDTILTVAPPGVLDNDSDADADGLTAVLDAGPANGALTLNADGSFSYTPNPDFNGSDSFSYHASDGTADSNVAAVTIRVNAINDAPLAVDDAYATDEGATLTVAPPGVLDNDTDAENDLLTAVLDTAPSNGSLTLNADGSFNYTPNAGFTGSDSFSYHASDGSADSNVVTVSIRVNGAQLALTSIAPNSAAAGSTVDVTVSGSGFQPGAALVLENGQGPAPDVTNVVVVDSTTLTATISIKEGGPPRERTWDVQVTNADGQTDVLFAGFTVMP